jgi:hypothetical protein
LHASIAFMLAAGAALAQGVALPVPPPEGMQEILRIRVQNSPGGSIGVSTDGGKRYIVVGQVLKPASTTEVGHAASIWAPKGAVSAVAIHGIRIRVGDARADEKFPRSLSLVPRDFRYIPVGYGGHVPGDSGIYTDVRAGESIFRNLAPRAGSPVYLEAGAELVPLPDDYTPSEGDVLVISVQAPTAPPEWIEFENWEGGRVIAHNADGTETQIAVVQRPVLGVGRFDGTSYTGEGRINTVHSGVVTISAAPLSGSLLPEGKGPERRGGFMIQPAVHAETQPGLTQVMVIAPLEGAPALEGAEPVFASTLGLAYSPDSPPNSFSAEIRIDNGPWEPVPAMTGRIDDAFTAAYLRKYFTDAGTPREITSGVTHVRIHIPKVSEPYLVQQARTAARPVYPEQESVAGEKRKNTVTGIVALKARVEDIEAVKYVLFYIDGTLIGIDNALPYGCDWNTATVPDGEHTVEVVAVDGSGSRVRSTTSVVWVANEE